jgi:hypothetical protein
LVTFCCCILLFCDVLLSGEAQTLSVISGGDVVIDPVKAYMTLDGYPVAWKNSYGWEAAAPLESHRLRYNHKAQHARFADLPDVLNGPAVVFLQARSCKSDWASWLKSLSSRLLSERHC